MIVCMIFHIETILVDSQQSGNGLDATSQRNPCIPLCWHRIYQIFILKNTLLLLRAVYFQMDVSSSQYSTGALVCFPLTAFQVLKIDLEYYRLWVVSKFFAKDIEATHIQCIGFDAQTNLNVWFLCEL